MGPWAIKYASDVFYIYFILNDNIWWTNTSISFHDFIPQTLNNRIIFFRNAYFPVVLTTDVTSNGSWRQGIKGEMTCTVYVALVW